MSTKRRAIFFDRDNTLIISDGYLGDPSLVRLVPDAAIAIARARKLGFVVATFSNQSGVARGMFGEDDVRAVNARMDAMLRVENGEAVIERHDFCPYHPQAAVEAYRRESELRKPDPGMLFAAATAMNVDLTASWVIGDAPRDIEAGVKAGCRTILFQDPSFPASAAAKERMRVKPELIARTLTEAIDYIERHPHRPGSEPKDEPSIEAGPSELSSVDSPTDLTPTPTAKPSNGDAISKSGSNLEMLAAEILREIRHSREVVHADFSVSKLLAGLAQVVSFSMAFLAYLNRHEENYGAMLLIAIWMQVLTTTLLVMSKHR